MNPERQQLRQKRPRTGSRPARIAITGMCGSGKTLLAAALRERGYDAEAVAQEHSQVPGLFLHHHPDIVIYLEVSDATVALRKRTAWEPEQLAEQRRRLKLARRHADIRLSTDGLTPARLLAGAEAALAKHL